MPLWGNPLLQLPDGGGCLEAAYGDVAASSIRYLSDLRRAGDALDGCTYSTFTRDRSSQIFGAAAAQRLPASFHHCRLVIQRLWEHIPRSWLEAYPATAVRPASLAMEARHTDSILHCLGWQGSHGGRPVMLDSYRVRDGTAMLLARRQDPRRRRLAAFEALAASDPPPPPAASPAAAAAQLAPAAAAAVPAAAPVAAAADAAPAAAAPAAADPPPIGSTPGLFRHLWRLPVSNDLKEVFWRLAQDALPLASRMPSTVRPCPCGAADPRPGRQHHFWDCPVAVGVVAEISAALGGAPLARSDIWLMRCPAAAHDGAWKVVCLIALAAMDFGRRYLIRHGLAASVAASPPDPNLPTLATRSAVAHFWELIQDFCTVGNAPVAWRTAILPPHPFFHWDALSSRWLLGRPPE